MVVGSCGVVWATTKNKSVPSPCKMEWLVELSINERAGLQKNRDVKVYSEIKLETIFNTYMRVYVHVEMFKRLKKTKRTELEAV